MALSLSMYKDSVLSFQHTWTSEAPDSQSMVLVPPHAVSFAIKWSQYLEHTAFTDIKKWGSINRNCCLGNITTNGILTSLCHLMHNQQNLDVADGDSAIGEKIIAGRDRNRAVQYPGCGVLSPGNNCLCLILHCKQHRHRAHGWLAAGNQVHNS